MYLGVSFALEGCHELSGGDRGTTGKGRVGGRVRGGECVSVSVWSVIIVHNDPRIAVWAGARARVCVYVW